MKIYTHEPDYFERTPVEKQRVCLTCNCYQLEKSADGVSIRCAIDHHYIGYINAYEQWCRRWKKAYWVRDEDGEAW